ncbi:hypothetical protein predicted by Glimmer/Critica [Sorangium cellulosum So ce56]|uniref:CHAT domain-containing protein n=1 Tax=Sorangium cellulosum (strain So ce56) TaxID=448385 RepID=A9F8J8_SORC5|nr:hypothetical protein [Sorangium cellulosum]CAN94663.1 hypothetical protein predicted by Glimmer/Critica [Sorangium cellulosum So ce56]
MGNALLDVALDGAGLSYLLQPDGSRSEQLRIQGPRLHELERLAEESRRYFVRLDASLYDLCETFRRLAVSPELETALRGWAADAGPGATLGVQSTDDDVRVPWELLPHALGLRDLMVVRVAQPTAAAGSRRSVGPRHLLVAAWSTSPMGECMRGVGVEVRELSRFGGSGIEVATLHDRPFEDLKGACAARAPGVVHLVVNVSTEDPPRLLIVLDGSKCDVDLDTLSSSLAGPLAPQLVVLNTCFAGRTVARHLCQRLGCVAVGWATTVGDLLAPEFAAYFYARLLDGMSVVGAVRSFMRRFELQLGNDRPIPVIWLPALDAADLPILLREPPPQPAQRQPAAALFDMASPGMQYRQPAAALFEMASPGVQHRQPAAVPFEMASPGMQHRRLLAAPTRSAALPEHSAEAAAVRLDFQALPAICPALLKNGRPLFRNPRIVTNQRRRVRLEIVCDTGSATSVYRRMVEIEPPSTPVIFVDMQFPALYDLIDAGTHRRYVSFSVRVVDRDEVLDEVMCASLWLGVDEWIDQRELWPFLPAFVRPSCSGVSEILDRAGEVLRENGGPGDALDGYARDASSAVSKQIQAIFQALRHKLNVGYIAPQAGRVRVPGAGDLAVQLVRPPAAIVKHRRGTCHDLALLFASCAEHLGIHPVIVVGRHPDTLSGHTFFGFWVGEREHARHWKDRSPSGDRTQDTEFGAGWLIRSPGELRALVQNQQIVVVEATALTRRGDDGHYTIACKEAADLVAKMTAADLDAAVDVAASRHAVQPL